MTNPTEKERETAREIVAPFVKQSGGSLYAAINANGLAEVTARALANTRAEAFAAGRADRQAEDAEIVKSIAEEYTASDERYSGFEAEGAMAARDAILAPSSGDSYEARIRAEIAEKVAVLVKKSRDEVTDNYNRALDDVLAVIDGGEK